MIYLLHYVQAVAVSDIILYTNDGLSSSTTPPDIVIIISTNSMIVIQPSIINLTFQLLLDELFIVGVTFLFFIVQKFVSLKKYSVVVSILRSQFLLLIKKYISIISNKSAIKVQKSITILKFLKMVTTIMLISKHIYIIQLMHSHNMKKLAAFNQHHRSQSAKNKLKAQTVAIAIQL